MPDNRVIKVTCYYRDASLLERIIAAFRRLLIDIDWVYGRLVDNNGLYEVYLAVRAHPNLVAAILDLSKTVNVVRVEVLDDVGIINLQHDRPLEEFPFNNGKAFIVYVPRVSSVKCLSWGEDCGADIHR